MLHFGIKNYRKLHTKGIFLVHIFSKVNSYRRPKMSILLSSRNHSLTFGVSVILLSVVMLIFLLHKTHEQLIITRGDMEKISEKYTSLTKQFESLYEYKERLENSIVVDLKEKKSSMTTQIGSLKSELAVLKQSHRTEMQRLQDELDLCRRHEEMAVIRNQPQRDEALPPQVHASENNSSPNDKVPLKDKFHSGGDHDIKVINSLSKSTNHNVIQQQPVVGNVIHFIQGDKDTGGVAAGGGLVSPITNQPPVVQPSMDPNQDPVGNVFI